ncbi:MAG: hypothetical protein ACXW3D_06830 [Caulobacteraceae bacterium]
MPFSQARPLDPWQWLGAPAVLCLLAAILLAIPVKLFGFRPPEPVWPLVLAFAWAVIRPSILAPLALLLLGLFLDLLWGAPLGLWGLASLTGYGVVVLSRSMMTGQSRSVLWSWYAIMCGLSMTAAYVITMLDSGTAPNLWAVFWQFLPTALLYPLAHRLIERFEDADVRFR